MRPVSVVGIGSTPFGRHEDTAVEVLAAAAAREAILDAGIERGEIGAVYLGNFVSGVLSGQEILVGLVADDLGLANVPPVRYTGLGSVPSFAAERR